jgi:nucleotide-binding universal stress UspA family protein
MSGFERVVVALGAPDGDASLMAYAVMLARLGRARELRFVHVADASAPAPAMRDVMRARADEATQGLSVRVGCDVLHGSLTDRLLDYVTEFQADLVLIGSKKHKLGARLAMVAPCSVAVVPDGHPATLSHILVAVDFSDDAGRTLDWVTSLAAASGVTRCTALHVITHESSDLFAGAEQADEQTEAMQRVLASANTHGVDVTVRLVDVSRSTDIGRSHPLSLAASIQGADVAHTILAEAAAVGADCLALSTRGRSRSASILLGSVAEKVIERSPLPLLVGKHRGRNLGLAAILLGATGAGVKTN